jgi:uncharacterized protein (DUF3820 family)
MSRVKYEPVKKHYTHPISIKIGKFGVHKGKVMCKLCNEFVKWATKEEIKIYKEMNK